jgi:hypothetical protein
MAPAASQASLLSTSEELDARLAVLHVGTAPVAHLLELGASTGGWGDDTRLD